MDHPLIGENNAKLRLRVIQLLRSAYSVMRNGNIVFVRGGNCPGHMRQQFRAYCETQQPTLQIFFPEFAMKSYFSERFVKPFNLAEFEEIVAELSHAIVLFPEAAGSYAETGYFCVRPKLANKTILVLDKQWQSRDSFISMGPALKFNAASRFRDIIQLEYTSPDFS